MTTTKTWTVTFTSVVTAETEGEALATAGDNIDAASWEAELINEECDDCGEPLREDGTHSPDAEDTTCLHGAGTCTFGTCTECQLDAQCPDCGEFSPIVTTMNAWRECPNGHGRFM